MQAFDYESLSGPDEPVIRSDLAQAHRAIWKKISGAGNWFGAEDRLAIAQESRNARTCRLCAERKTALSPYGDGNAHDATTNLPMVLVDAVHRITTDPTRITKTWIDSLAKEGVSDAHYVELLGIVVAVISIDAFHRAMGLPLEPLPAAQDGEPSGYRPPGASDHKAYVPSVAPVDLTENEADLYHGSKQTGNVLQAMSLVPDSVRMLSTLSEAQYMGMFDVANPTTNNGRALSRSQIELTAGRVSALSDCFY